MADINNPDGLFYSPNLEADGTTTYSENDLAVVKKVMLEMNKAVAKDLLAPTDWLVIRNFEEPGSIPADVVAYRKAVRDASRTYCANAESAANIPVLAALYSAGVVWPAKLN